MGDAGDALREWCLAHGAELRGVAVADGLPGTGRGMVATRALAVPALRWPAAAVPAARLTPLPRPQPETVIVSVPLDICVTLDAAQRALIADCGAAPDAAAALRAALEDVELLTWFVVHERLRGADSPLHTYFESVPTAYDLFAWFDDADIAELQFSHLREIASGERLNMATRRERICRMFAQHSVRCELAARDDDRGSTVLDDVYRFAYAAVETRSVHVAELKEAMLVPYFDMLNHADGSRTAVRLDASRTCFELVHREPWAAGREVFLEYHAHSSNEFLLRYYGYVAPNNPCNAVMVPLRVLLRELRRTAATPGRAKQGEALLMSHAAFTSEAVLSERDGPSAPLLAACALIVATQQRASTPLCTVGEYYYLATSSQHESALACLRDLLLQWVKDEQLATGARTDASLLESSAALSFRRRCIIQLRLETKLLLARHIARTGSA